MSKKDWSKKKRKPRKERKPRARSRSRIKKSDVVEVSISDLEGTVIYTDGACVQNSRGSSVPKWTGGFGYCSPDTDLFYESIGYSGTTNNRMELKAIIHALEFLKVGGDYKILSDSQYCTRSINEWLNGWVRRGKLGEKKNPGLWRRFMAIRDKHREGGSKIRYLWVKGHNGLDGNEQADALATNAMYSDMREVCSDSN